MVKPKVLIICDVKKWAWDIKAQYLKTYLQDYYDIDVVYSVGRPLRMNKSKYDIYFTFGWSLTKYLRGINKNKCITGVTAHRPWKKIKKSMDITKFHHANSVLLYKELKKQGKNPFYVPNGVDTTLFYPIKPLFANRNTISIGHIGKKSASKNQASFIEPIMKEMRIDYKPHYNNYKTSIPHKQMIHKYQDFDVFIAASSEDGTPNGMLEAGACGRSVIINKIGNAPELITNGVNGFVIPMQKEAYIDTIRWCKRNPNNVIKMGENMQKEICEKWTWELMSKNYLLMFDKIIGVRRDKKLYDNPALNHIKG